MSTDPIGAAFGRDDATVAAGGPQIAAEPSYELTGIAMAIERIEALLAACGPAPESSDALERIADIAFVLHERDVEASLCDALDAAVRELSNAHAVKRTNVQHLHQAAELVRELSHRLADMSALLQVSPPPAESDTVATEAATAEQPAGEDALDGEIPRQGLFAAELLEDDEFARAVAELAASLPALAEPVEVFPDAQREEADRAAAEPAPEPDAAIAEREREPGDLAADEPMSAPEPAEAITEAQREPADLAAAESALAPEPAEANLETQNELADLGATAPAIAPAAAEPIAKTQIAPAGLAPDDGAVVPAQAPPEMNDEPAVIEQMPAEAFSIAEIASEQPPHEDARPAPDALPEAPRNEEISNAAQSSEGTLSETLSGGARLENAGAAAAPPDLTADSHDHSLASEPATVSPPDADASLVPIGTLSPAPEGMPESETALAPDSSSVAALSAEPELPPCGEAPLPPAEVGAAIGCEPSSDQNTARHDGGDGPIQITGEASRRDVDDTAAQTTIDVSEAPPRRVTESSQALLPELALVDPEDDPGDLFESVACVAAPNAGTNIASEVAQPAAATQAHAAAAAVPDPLVAMRALSAEELLAFFT